MSHFAIVRNVKSCDLYSWDGEKFTNLRTGASGVVSDDVARSRFKINLPATDLLNTYPVVIELIQKLNLICDVASLQNEENK